MEYYTQEAIEKANKVDPKKKKIKQIMKKIIVFIITFLILYIVIMPTPLYDLAVVSIRWGRPMIYKEHIQMGAIWDLRKRTHTAFTAYPLFGDPEEDEFYIERDNRLIVFPWNIRDAYIFVYKRDEIEAEALRIAHEVGFENVKVDIYNFLPPSNNIYGILHTPTTNELIKNGLALHLQLSVYLDKEMSEDEIIVQYISMLKKMRYEEYDQIDLKVYYNKEKYNAIKNAYSKENCDILMYFHGKYVEINNGNDFYKVEIM